MTIVNPRMRDMQESLQITKETAATVKFVMRNYKDLPKLLDGYGNVVSGLHHTQRKRLLPIEAVKDSLWPEPNETPQGTVEQALQIIDRLIETHGVERLVFKDRHEYRIELDYCNAGDTYTATIYYSTADDDFVLGDWGSAVEFYETQGYRTLESHEMHI